MDLFLDLPGWQRGRRLSPARHAKACSLLICYENQLTGFYMMVALVFNELISLLNHTHNTRKRFRWAGERENWCLLRDCLISRTLKTYLLKGFSCEVPRATRRHSSPAETEMNIKIRIEQTCGNDKLPQFMQILSRILQS